MNFMLRPLKDVRPACDRTAASQREKREQAAARALHGQVCSQ